MMWFLYLYIFINAAILVSYFWLWLMYIDWLTANVVYELHRVVKPIGKPWYYILLPLLIVFLFPAIAVWYVVIMPIMVLVLTFCIAVVKR